VSLPGSEGLLLADLDSLRQHQGERGDDLFIIVLLGKITGETHDLAHLLPCTHVMSSGINVKQAIDNLTIDIKEKHGF
jgi:hypothetical protein